MKRRQKNYWIKLKESFTESNKARSRAAQLRAYEHTSHVTVAHEDERWVVRYSAAQWWLEEMKRVGLSI